MTNGNLLTSAREGDNSGNFYSCLECEEQKESHHQTEKTHGLRQGKSKNGIREQLLFQGWVTGVSDDERSEDATNSGTGSSHSNCGSSCTNELGGRVNVPRHSRGLKRTYWGSRHQGLLRGLLGQQGVAGRSQVHLRSWGQSGTGNWGDNPGTVHFALDFSLGGCETGKRDLEQKFTKLFQRLVVLVVGLTRVHRFQFPF